MSKNVIAIFIGVVKTGTKIFQCNFFVL
ncbi:hypothetical protein F383_36064 [Gossypium arboreum]|uniref:Uncharacterized protein n=1 Tax=Gossypium arboreum TaxID=29729 RepID=A0A0B0N7R9_GOSAR|nr:hypothetical protein F383_36064 [Gossypium arboreum]